MSYLIVAVIFALIGFAGCFLIYRNNFTKIGRIMEVLDKGVFDANTAKAIEAIIKGEDCKDCK
jgi:multisubunit Na+/H+ antiporter MnhC subunit